MMGQWEKEGMEMEGFDKLMMEEWGKTWQDESYESKNTNNIEF